MAPEPEQVPSQTCGCKDCLIDYPPELYGHRPPQNACTGVSLVRYRTSDGKHRAKKLPALADAHQFLAAVRTKVRRHAA